MLPSPGELLKLTDARASPQTKRIQISDGRAQAPVALCKSSPKGLHCTARGENHCRFLICQPISKFSPFLTCSPQVPSHPLSLLLQQSHEFGLNSYLIQLWDSNLPHCSKKRLWEDKLPGEALFEYLNEHSG